MFKQIKTKTQNICGLALPFEEEKEIRHKTRDLLKNLKVNRPAGWMTKERTTLAGNKVIPYKSIENDIYYFYFDGKNNFIEPGIARIAVGELEFDLSQKFSKEFMVLKMIVNIILECEGELDKYDEDLNGLSFKELYKKYSHSIYMQYVRMFNRVMNSKYTRNPNYKVVKIESYEQAKKYGKYTCKNSPWCLSINEDKYNAYVDFGNNSMYFILANGYKDIEEPDVNSEPVFPDFIDDETLFSISEDGLTRMYDQYGLSMIIVVVNPNGTLNSCVSRWNHKFIVKSRDYLNEEQISTLVGRNFYKTFLPVD